jgi:2-oxoglutarate ferredoxin oxidoreductase subunit beta
VPGSDLITPAANTWCPGCGNFAIEHALKDVIGDLIARGTPAERIVLVTGIGCHGKMADYLGVNSFYSIHGRTLPVATGIKIANPELTVLCCAGDGDCYGEGLEHLLFAAKRNIDVTLLVHDNRVYGLTTGQYTPTSPLGFPGRSTPKGTPEYPLNPVELMIAAGATFVARGYSRRIPQLRELVHAALRHRGFSFLDVLQICATFYNQTAYYDEHVYDLDRARYPTGDREGALARAREWDYSREAPIALGALYETTYPTFEERLEAERAPTKDHVAVMRRLVAERT